MQLQHVGIIGRGVLMGFVNTRDGGIERDRESDEDRWWKVEDGEEF